MIGEDRDAAPGVAAAVNPLPSEMGGNPAAGGVTPPADVPGIFSLDAVTSRRLPAPGATTNVQDAN